MYEQEREILDFVMKQSNLGKLKEPYEYVNYLRQSIHILNYYRKKRNSWMLSFYTAILVWISISVLKMIF